MVLTLLQIGVYATDAEKTNGILSYRVQNGEVIITGCDRSATGSLNIPEEIDGYPVTEVGDHAFLLTNLTRIQLPDSVKKLGVGVFMTSETLKTIILSESLLEIPERTFAFSGPVIRKIYIPASIKYIGENAFYPYNRDEVIADFNFDGNAMIYYGGNESQWNAIAVHNNQEAAIPEIRNGSRYVHSFPHQINHSHSFDDGTVVREPTAYEPGLKLIRCLDCEKEKLAIIPATGHTPFYDVIPAQ